jgi:tetratricopeptide (TPR) repeat protein
MSVLDTPTIRKFLFALGLVGGALSQSVVLAGDINQTVSDKSIAVVHTGKGDVRIGITLEEYEARLKVREKEVTERLEKAYAQQRKLYESELEGIRQRLRDVKLSYQEYIKDLKKRIVQLESIRGQVPDEVLAQAQSALARGDAEQADALFKQIEDQAAATIKVAGEAAHQRCQIALDAIRYREAFVHCQRAVQWVPDNTTYLNDVGEMARLLGRYRVARDYVQQALTSDLKTYGQDHPRVAGERNNLGLAWANFGEYRKAIGYYEQALASDLKTYGEDHTRVAEERNNLGAAWRALGEHRKAIGYYEQALTSDLKTYGEDHPRVAEERNNLGAAWRALGEYRKAIGYYEQALASGLKTYGEDHPRVATTRNNLGGAWDALGEYRKAIGYYEQALASDLKTYGENHPSVAVDRYNLGKAWRDLGEPRKAIGYYEQALVIAEKTLGADHPNTKEIRRNLEALKDQTE